jgi:MerR family transcriptional regulator, light-induced transcriptional regulator
VKIRRPAIGLRHHNGAVDTPAATATKLSSIAQVERETGLSKDTLRIWERRYGFPRPERNAGGDRLYPPGQVEQLRLIRQLLDSGHRPGGIVARPLSELRELARSIPSLARSDVDEGHDDAHGHNVALQACIAVIRDHRTPALEMLLHNLVEQLGLAQFVTTIAAPLTRWVGAAWSQGKVAIYEEHLFTQILQRVLRSAIQGAHRAAPESDPGAKRRPRLLLTTLPGEQHGLGLLMLEALLTLDGAECESLGTQTPVAEVALAAAARHSDIVCISASACMNSTYLVAWLRQLREDLPSEVSLWVGGSAPVLATRRIREVEVFEALTPAREALSHWRARVAA